MREVCVLLCKTPELATSGKKILLAQGANEAGGVVGLAQCSDHLTLHKVPAAIATGPVHALVVQGAEIIPVLHEEAALGQIAATHCRRVVRDVRWQITEMQQITHTQQITEIEKITHT